jgi:hypothetical protein
LLSELSMLKFLIVLNSYVNMVNIFLLYFSDLSNNHLSDLIPQEVRLKQNLILL